MAQSSRRVTLVGRFKAVALSLLMLASPAPAGQICLVAASVLVATEASAQTRSSGGYSRSRSSSSRTPSFGGGGYSSRTPSTSGGYSRPSASSYDRSPSFGGGSYGSWSAGDRAFSRERSGEALGGMRAQDDAVRRQQEQAAARSSTTNGGGIFGSRGYGYGNGGYATTTGGFGYGNRSGWFGARGWSAPGYAYSGQRSFGIWDGIFLWFMLDNLSRPGYGDFFHNHQNDPGYRQWRAEAEGQAAGDAELRQKLDALDRQVAARQDQPRDPNYLPPDVPVEIATAADRERTPSTALAGGGDLISTAVFAGGGLLIFGLGIARRRQRAGHAGGSGTMGTLGTAGAMLRHKLSGKSFEPSLFRVGMTLTSDPTPFILAAGSTKVPLPEAPGGNLLVNVQEVGRIEDGAASLVRLYLPDRRSLFQLHLDAAGTPDECRFFGIIDEVAPADAAEWAVWLGANEGMIGWPDFQTKDGKVYTRAWAPGSSWVAPRAIEETIETVAGTRAVRSQAMLYAAPTGVAAPAPETEYILVAAVEAGGQAWVEISAGIDINPAALSLA